MKSGGHSRIARALASCILAFGAILSRQASAAPLPPEDEVPEMMMEIQGAYATWLAYTYGTPSETLHYTSTTDIAARSFTFAMLAGQTYKGQPATLLASGSFNAAASRWNVAATGSVGSNNWSSSATGDDPPLLEHWEIDIVPSTITIISDVTYTQTATRTVSQGTFTVKGAILGDVISTSLHTDNLVLQGDDAGKWVWDDGSINTPEGDRRVDSEGFTPPAGGIGNFSTAITVPEPGSLLILLPAAFVGMTSTRAGGRSRHPRKPRPANVSH